MIQYAFRVRIRQIIGGILIILSSISIVQSYRLKSQAINAYKAAGSEVLLSSDLIELKQSSVFKATYRNAHSVIAENAIEVEDDVTSDLRVDPSLGESLKLVYSKGDSAYLFADGNQIEVTKLREFDGEIVFVYQVCGCETSGPIIIFYGCSVLGIIFIPLGLYLIFKKRTKQPSGSPE